MVSRLLTDKLALAKLLHNVGGLPCTADLPRAQFRTGAASKQNETVTDGESSSHPYDSPAKYLRRQDFYHYRRKDVEKREVFKTLKAQAEESGTATPWLLRNLPIKPPPSVAVSTTPSPDKSFKYHKADLEAESVGESKVEQRELDVLTMKVGYSADAQYALPDQVKAFVLDQTTICIFGTDKNQVSQIASNIRRIKPPEPYKGSGIRIVGETIKIKERKGKK